LQHPHAFLDVPGVHAATIATGRSWIDLGHLGAAGNVKVTMNEVTSSGAVLMWSRHGAQRRTRSSSG